MKFLLQPEYNRVYDFRIAHCLGHALEDAGHTYELMPTEGFSVEDANKYDVVFGTNRARPEDLSPDVIFISWVQDYRPVQEIDYASRARGDDIIYSMGSEEWIGLGNLGANFRGSLLTGVDPELLNSAQITQDIDFSICGYIAIPFTKVDMTTVERRCLKEAERLYQPLTGSSHAVKLASALIKFLDELASTGQVPEGQYPSMRKHCEWIAIEYPRYIDRLRLAQMAYFVSSKCKFIGVNWQKYYQFGDCTYAPIKDESKLHDIYRRSKINLHNNWNGFGLHNRVLEAMAVGGFVMAHACADPDAAGRLTTSFEPGTHFGEYTPENFIEQSRYWLHNDAARNKAIQESRKVVVAKHLWRHRAQQILDDLAGRDISSRHRGSYHSQHVRGAA